MGSMKKGTLSDRVIEYILHSSLEELREVTVYRLAQIFRVNRCYLARRFKGDKDFTLCEFLVREKLFRAAAILKESDRVTINELSELIGFSNANYFIRIFKEYFGTSPGRYRECLRRRPGTVAALISPNAVIETAVEESPGVLPVGHFPNLGMRPPRLSGDRR